MQFKTSSSLASAGGAGATVSLSGSTTKQSEQAQRVQQLLKTFYNKLSKNQPSIQAAIDPALLESSLAQQH